MKKIIHKIKMSFITWWKKHICDDVPNKFNDIF